MKHNEISKLHLVNDFPPLINMYFRSFVIKIIAQERNTAVYCNQTFTPRRIVSAKAFFFFSYLFNCNLNLKRAICLVM